MDGPLTIDSTELTPRLRHPPSQSVSSSPLRSAPAPKHRAKSTPASLPAASPARLSMGASPSHARPPRESVHSADVFVMEQSAGVSSENPNHYGDPAAYEGAPFWEEHRSASEVYLPRPYYPPEKPKGLFSGQKGCIIVVLLALVVFVVGLIVGLALKSRCANRMVYVVQADHNYSSALSQYMQAQVNADLMQRELQFFSSKAHQAGSKENLLLAERIYGAWSHLPFDELFFDNYTVQLSLAPEANTVELVNVSTGKEIFNANSSSKAEAGVFPYNAYSPNKSVEGDYIFINFGTAKDLQHLRDLNVTLVGRIAIARLGKGYRSGPAIHAAKAGAIGVVMYPDPEEFAPDSSRVYPKGWWLPKDAPVFGNVRGRGGGGDPLTPDLPAVDGIYPSRRSDNTTIEFAPIPVQPIGYHDARKLLDRLGGREVPAEWSGSLAKFLGPAPGLRLRIRSHNQLVNRRIQNVIAVLRGDLEPDRLVIVGNHYDAWINGAFDPLTGTVIVQQVSKLFAKEIDKAYRPRRTIVFAAWDGEEMGTIGSTEFTERLTARLAAQAVAYVNLDCPVKGNFSFFARTSPLLRSVVEAAAGAVHLGGKNGSSVLAEWTKKLPKNASDPSQGPEQPLLGAGSDQGAFLFKLGVPSTYPQYMYNGFYPNVPAYHTKYDIFEMLNSVIDPGFKNHAILARVIIDLVLRLADCPLLPFSLSEYPMEMRRFALKLKQRAKHYEPLADGSIDLKFLFAAIDDFEKAVHSFMGRAESLNATNVLQLRMANDAMMQVSRAFLWPEGLPSRSYYKNILLSSGLTNSYEGSFLTGLYDALYLGSKSHLWNASRRHFSILVNAIRGVTLLLRGVLL